MLTIHAAIVVCFLPESSCLYLSADRPPPSIPKDRFSRIIGIASVIHRWLGVPILFPVVRVADSTEIWTHGAASWFGLRLTVSRAGSVFDETGELKDDKIRAQLAQFMADFAAFAAQRPKSTH